MRDLPLARRIIGYLVVAQLGAFLIAALLLLAVEVANIQYFRRSIDEMATYRVSNLVIDSLILDRQGVVRVEPNAALRREISETPRFKFAVFSDAREPLPGSSPELASALTRAGVIQISGAHLHFNLPGDPETSPMGFMERRKTPFGRLHVAVYRQMFRPIDLFWQVFEFFQWDIITVVLVILVSAGTAWYAVRRGLAPLRAAALRVEEVDLDQLTQGVRIEQVPTEIRPFVDAIDGALVRLAASAARMRRFTANAAHELRTPVAVMRARLENADASQLTSDLLNDSRQLQTLVEQMLVTIRLSENQALCDETLELAGVVRDVVSGFVLLAVQRGRRIEFETCAAAVRVRGNRRAIECVVSNLVDNALRAEPVGGAVLVRVDADATVHVIDHGDGVAPDDREKIFEPFWRKSEETPGAGLGLAITKELMERLHGGVRVADTPGGGATFTLSFVCDGTDQDAASGAAAGERR
jgi:two-component system OmpR family sensor kinase